MSFQRRKILGMLLRKGMRVVREKGPHTTLAGEGDRFAILPHGNQH